MRWKKKLTTTDFAVCVTNSDTNRPSSARETTSRITGVYILFSQRSSTHADIIVARNRHRIDAGCISIYFGRAIFFYRAANRLLHTEMTASYPSREPQQDSILDRFPDASIPSDRSIRISREMEKFVSCITCLRS